jgi:hypothetical protein
MEPARAQQCLAKAGDFGIVSTKELSPEQAEEIASFTSPVNLVEIFKTLDWTLSAEIGILIEIANNQQEKANNRVNAIKLLREIYYVALGSSGMKAHVTKEVTGPDGEKMTFTTDLVSSALAGNKKPVTSAEVKKESTNESTNSSTSNGPTGNTGLCSRTLDTGGDGRPRTDTGSEGGDTGGESTPGGRTGEASAECSTNAGLGESPKPSLEQPSPPTKSFASGGHKPPARDSLKLFPGISGVKASAE